MNVVRDRINNILIITKTISFYGICDLDLIGIIMSVTESITIIYHQDVSCSDREFGSQLAVFYSIEVGDCH